MSAAPRPGRVGILGGTFDPIHIGHIATGLAARTALALDELRIMPARIPPHRHQGPSASTYHRFAMAALAINGLDGFSLADDELAADGPSYTALTLERLARNGYTPARIFFITGADAFAEIETWYRYPSVLDLASFVVIARPGVPVESLTDRLPALRDRMRVPADAPGDRPAIYLVGAQTPDVSSTEIRRRLRAGETIAGLVPPAVESHIARHRLYAEPATI